MYKTLSEYESQLFVNKETFNRSKYKTITNCTYLCKPRYGLWTSTYLPEAQYPSDWVEWCVCNNFAINKTIGSILRVLPGANIYVINSLEDLKALFKWYKNPEPSGLCNRPLLDFCAVSKHFDAIHLTQRGESKTRLCLDDIDLYGWDCESTVWFNTKYLKLEQEIHIPRNEKRESEQSF